MGIIDRMLHEDENLESTSPNPPEETKHAKVSISKVEVIAVLLILTLGLIYRLWFIYRVSGPENAGVGWYGDTYHHWQIAYLTLTQGLSHGFLRLWDLKGMEFFWGPLHPILSILAFKITGSVSVVMIRYLSLIFGLGTLLLGYLLTKKSWGKAVAFSFIIFGAFFPIAVFNDVTGSLEPIGVCLILLAIWLSDKKQFLSGVVFALSSMVRAEAWVFSLGIIFAIFINKKSKNGLLLFLGWLLTLVLYMKYLLDYTGNPIYPLWWNYLANGAGAWAGGLRSELTPLQLQIRPILIGVALISVIGLIYNLIKRPRGYLISIFGWGNIFFVGAFMGLSHYLTGWEWWFPVIRFFVWPYLFLSILIFAFLGHEERKHPAWKSLLVFSVITLTFISQLTWFPIMKHFSTTVKTWEVNVVWGKELGNHYKEGTILFPEGEPNFTYTAVKYGGISGEHFLSQMFDPYYYIGEDKTESDWGKHSPEIFSWIVKNNIRLAVFRIDTKRYQDLVKHAPELFEYIVTLPGGTYQIYKVMPERAVIN